MQTHKHYFTLCVETHLTRQAAEHAVLTAFALRQPDDCAFTIRAANRSKTDWLVGKKDGYQQALDEIAQSLTALRHKAAKKGGWA